MNPSPARPACATYSIPEAAAVIGISADSLYRAVRQGRIDLRVHRIGRQLRVSQVNLDRYLSEGQVAS